MHIRKAAAAALVAIVALSASTTAQSGRKAFTGMRLIDGGDGPPVDNATIIVDQGKVVAVGPASQTTIGAGDERISLAGKTVMPGLVNAHGHVANVERDLRLYANYGVTTVFSLGNDNNAAEAIAARDRQDAARLPRTRLFTAGRIVAADTPAAARTQVDANADQHVDLIKIRIEDNFGTTAKMPPDVYRAVIDQSHRRNLRTAAHMFYLADAKDLLDAGVDLLAHSIRDQEVDEALIAKLKARNVCVVPTLMRDESTFVYESTPAFFSDPLFLKYADPREVASLQEPSRQQGVKTNRNTPKNKAALEMARRNVKALVAAGVAIAMGTDTGAGAGRFSGYFELLELERMVSAGLTPRQAIAAATRDAARCMGHANDTGTLTPGKWADLLVLDADPLVNIANARAISAVYIAGTQVPR
jgi:imidazolonepropionase-like amidohydrolase